MKREEILDTAKAAITGDRQNNYGDARENFISTGKLWEVVFGQEVSPEEFAICMILVKIDRLRTTPDHADSWVDICGYAALGGHVATEKPEKA